MSATPDLASSLTVDLDGASAEQVIESLGLELLDGEGCWFTVLWRTDHANAIYALLTPGAFSALHVLHEDELWTHIAGDPVELLLLHPGGAHDRLTLGRQAGQSPWVRVPAGSWQGARTTGEWSLVICSLSPPFSGLTLATAGDLAEWPAMGQQAQEFLRG